MSDKYASSQYLTHKFNAMHGCNMTEFFTMLFIAFVGLVILSILAGIVTAVMYDHFMAGFLGGFILLLFPAYKGTVFAAKKVGKLKEDKQDAYIQLVALRWMSNNPFFGLFVKNDMYVTYRGRWSTQRNKGA